MSINFQILVDRLDVHTYQIRTPDDQRKALYTLYAHINSWLESNQKAPTDSILMNKLIYYITKEIKRVNPKFTINSGWKCVKGFPSTKGTSTKWPFPEAASNRFTTAGTNTETGAVAANPMPDFCCARAWSITFLRKRHTSWAIPTRTSKRLPRRAAGRS